MLPVNKAVILSLTLFPWRRKGIFKNLIVIQGGPVYSPVLSVLRKSSEPYLMQFAK
jgi:hypothetical protein